MRIEEQTVLSASTDVVGKTMKVHLSLNSSSPTTGSAPAGPPPTKTPLPLSDRETIVKFNDSDVQVHYVPLVEDMDQEEINATWFQKEDFEAMKKENTHVAKIMKSSSKSITTPKAANPNMTFRGLEYRLPMIAKRRRTIMQRAAQAVFEEQSRQVQENTHDADLLATVYEGYTKICAADAERQGKDDEIAVTVMDQQQMQHQEDDTKQKPIAEETITEEQVVTHQYSDIFQINAPSDIQVSLTGMRFPDLETLSISDESSAATTLMIAVDEFDDDNISVLSDEFDSRTTSSFNSVSSRGKRIAKRLKNMLLRRNTRAGRQ